MVTRTGDYTWTVTAADGRYLGAMGTRPEHALHHAAAIVRDALGTVSGTWAVIDDDHYHLRADHGSSSRQRWWSTLRSSR